MKAVPLAGKRVPNPETRKPLLEEGEVVSPDFHSYWLRRQTDGDVRLVADDFAVVVPTEWDRMLEEALTMKADAKALDAEAAALQAQAKSKTDQAKSLRALAEQKDRAVKAALDGGKAS